MLEPVLREAILLDTAFEKVTFTSPSCCLPRTALSLGQRCISNTPASPLHFSDILNLLRKTTS